MLECAKDARVAFQALALNAIKTAKRLRKQGNDVLDLELRVRLRKLEVEVIAMAVEYRKCYHFCSLHTDKTPRSSL